MTEEIFYEEEIENTHITHSDEDIAPENSMEESLDVVSEEISAEPSEEFSDESIEAVLEKITDESSEEISHEIPEVVQRDISEEISSEPSDEPSPSDGIEEVVSEIESEEISSEPSDKPSPSDDIEGVASEIESEEISSEPSDDIEEVVSEIESEEEITATSDELKSVIEALMFVADEPLPFKQLCKVLGDINEDDVRSALNELVKEYDERNSGLEVREIAGGWRISTRPQNHEFIRKYLRSRPSARLSLPALETLAVIAYKQPVTIPEILEIRGVSSSSAIKTLLEKRLIVTKGRKETVGRPMMYGTSKEFLIQFGLKDLTELPSIEDFEDLAQ